MNLIVGANWTSKVPTHTAKASFLISITGHQAKVSHEMVTLPQIIQK
jgi:hypothetical protein